MFQFLGFLLLILLGVVLIGFVILLNVVRGVFRIGRKPRTSGQADGFTGQAGQANRTHGTVADDGTVTVEEGELHFKRKKIFDKDDGEYVSYEEVKE